LVLYNTTTKMSKDWWLCTSIFSSVHFLANNICRNQHCS
jgi:hypothetical protein